MGIVEYFIYLQSENQPGIDVKDMNVDSSLDSVPTWSEVTV